MCMAELERRITELSRNRNVVAYCGGPTASFADKAAGARAR